jgi:hypothetical protein
MISLRRLPEIKVMVPEYQMNHEEFQTKNRLMLFVVSFALGAYEK